MSILYEKIVRLNVLQNVPRLGWLEQNQTDPVKKKKHSFLFGLLSLDEPTII